MDATEGRFAYRCLPLVMANQFGWIVRCPLTFEVSVVASDQASCPAPDTANVICPPFTYVYSATGGPPHVATIPFPGGCCITNNKQADPLFLNPSGLNWHIRASSPAISFCNMNYIQPVDKDSISRVSSPAIR